MWVFLFFFFPFQAYQSSVFVTCVKASYMFNKANYLVKNIRDGIILTTTGGKAKLTGEDVMRRGRWSPISKYV